MNLPEFRWGNWGESVGQALGDGYVARQRQNALAEALPAAESGDQNALARLARVSPEAYASVQNRLYQMQERTAANQRDEARTRRDLMRQGLTDAAGAIVNMPEAELPAAWGGIRSSLVSQYPELEPSLPPEYNPTVLATARGLAGIKPKQADAPGLINVSPGGAIFDEATRQPIYQAPYKPEDGPKPPAGYRWGQGGALTFIPGGPADPAVRGQSGGGIVVDPETGAITVSPQGFKPKPLPGELASRVALGETYARQVPDILGAIEEGKTSGIVNRAGVVAGVGDGAAVARRQASGVDALIRNLTGAGMSMSEAQEYANRYRIQANDAVETQRNKVLQLVSELRNIDATLKTQYGQAPSDAYSGIPLPPNLSDEVGQPPAQAGWGIKEIP